MVLIDDVQLLSRGEATREEFFHTFNALVQSGRQLVLTSDRHPAELDGIEERLSERFRSGLVVELEPPSFAVRRAILAKRARLDGIAVRDAVLDEISLRVDSSVRALEGALIQVVAYASLRGGEPDVETARKVLGRLPIPARKLTEIVDATARAFDLSAEELRARDRRPAIAFPRQVAMFLARELTDHSLPDIGRELGGRSHTTVLHALERVEQSLAGGPRCPHRCRQGPAAAHRRQLMAEPTARIHSFCTTAKQQDSACQSYRPRPRRHLDSTSIHNQIGKA